MCSLFHTAAACHSPPPNQNRIHITFDNCSDRFPTFQCTIKWTWQARVLCFPQSNPPQSTLPGLTSEISSLPYYIFTLYYSATLFTLLYYTQSFLTSSKIHFIIIQILYYFIYPVSTFIHSLFIHPFPYPSIIHLLGLSKPP